MNDQNFLLPVAILCRFSIDTRKSHCARELSLMRARGRQPASMATRRSSSCSSRVHYSGSRRPCSSSCSCLCSSKCPYHIRASRRNTIAMQSILPSPSSALLITNTYLSRFLPTEDTHGLSRRINRASRSTDRRAWPAPSPASHAHFPAISYQQGHGI